ncbi:MAG: hypothetical protein WC330_07230, partial [Candidatus Omnitrophota bacterium]
YPEIVNNPYAYTQGMADIFEGKHLFFLANKAKKAQIVKASLEGPITEDVPASMLQRHPKVTIVLDREAAGLLGKNTLNVLASSVVSLDDLWGTPPGFTGCPRKIMRDILLNSGTDFSKWWVYRALEQKVKYPRQGPKPREDLLPPAISLDEVRYRWPYFDDSPFDRDSPLPASIVSELKSLGYSYRQKDETFVLNKPSKFPSLQPPHGFRADKVVGVINELLIKIPDSHDSRIYCPHLGKGQTSDAGGGAYEGNSDAACVIKYLKAYNELIKKPTAELLQKATGTPKVNTGPYISTICYLIDQGISKKFITLIHTAFYLQWAVSQPMYYRRFEPVDFWIFQRLLEKFCRDYYSNGNTAVNPKKTSSSVSQQLNKGNQALVNGDLSPAASPAINLFDLKKDFELSSDNLKQIISSFKEDMKLGLSGNESSLAMLPTFVDNPTGKEKGKFLALDLGGTNFRVLMVDLKADGSKPTMIIERFKLAKEHITGTQEVLFNAIAAFVKQFLDKHNLTETYDLGFTFSFEVNQADIDKGITVRMSKGFTTTGIVGKDVVALLRDAFKRKGVNNVNVVAIDNDTTGTQVARAYLDTNTSLGVILGTGTNICVRLPMAMIEKSFPNKDKYKASHMIVNMESGNFNKNLPITKYDKILDSQSTNPKEAWEEKMVSGMYLGELMRITLLDLIRQKQLFLGKTPRLLRAYQRFETKYVGEIESLNFNKRINIWKLRWLFKKLILTRKDAQTIQLVANLISTRSARLAAALIVGAIQYIDPNIDNKHTVAVDGSVFEKHYRYQERMHEAFRELLSDKAANITTTLTHDGSGVGAAIIGAVASKAQMIADRKSQMITDKKIQMINKAKETQLALASSAAVSLSDRAIEMIRNDFSVDDEQLKNMVEAVRDEMYKGLAGERSSIRMLPTFIDNPTGKETGQYLALDLGGSNFRVLMVKLKGDGKKPTIVIKRFKLQKKHITKDGEVLFSAIASFIRKFLKKYAYKETYNLGFTFSFPVKQAAIDKGILIKWAKGFTAKNVKGRDVIALLKAALTREGVNNVRVVAIDNDTTGTQVARAYLDKNCDCGVIIATGTNVCLRVPMGMITKKFDNKDKYKARNMIINAESGNFNKKLPRNVYDEMLDKDSSNPGNQWQEKMVSGKYLGEVARLVLKGLTKEGLLFQGKVPDILKRKDRFGTETMAAISALKPMLKESRESIAMIEKIPMESPGYNNLLKDISKFLEVRAEFLRKMAKLLKMPRISLNDAEIIQEVIDIIAKRSAQIAAVVIAGALTTIDPDLSRPHTVAVDGSVFEKYPGYKKEMYEVFKKLFGSKASNIKMRLTHDGSGLGAAIIAAVAASHKAAMSSSAATRTTIKSKASHSKVEIKIDAVSAILMKVRGQLDQLEAALEDEKTFNGKAQRLAQQIVTISKNINYLEQDNT